MIHHAVTSHSINKVRSYVGGRIAVQTRSGYFAAWKNDELWRSGYFATVLAVGALGEFTTANATRTDYPFLMVEVEVSTGNGNMAFV